MRKLLTVTAFLFAAVFISVPPTTIWARSRKKASVTPVPVDTNDKITAVHLTSITVSVYATHTAKEYKVTPTTKVTVNGRAGTLSGLSTGMDVTVTPATDPTVAATIDARSPKRK